ncbi:hypothetical protein DFH09DRAFT_1425740 [Mycena vulgaris]|nr:hypothetical protein DFH09DRAFT_1425740 [Mycena vulgaris]
MSQTQDLGEGSSQECSPADCRRVTDLWFPDANLILRAENTLFRVHGGILAARSTIFGHMITALRPVHPEGQTFDGHPIVYLHDSAAEVEVFFMPAPSPTDFATAIGVMRLAHKYDVPYLFRRALRHLGAVYSTTLVDLVVTRGKVPHVEFRKGDPTVNLLMIRAASEVGAVWLLPCAYYSACIFKAHTLLSAGESWNALRTDEQQRCLTSQVDLVRATTRTYRFLRRLPSPRCSVMETCRVEFSRAQDLVEWLVDRKLDMKPLNASFVQNQPYIHLCYACLQLDKELFTEAQESFWRELPGIFGLPDWDELCKRRGEVLEVDT